MTLVCALSAFLAACETTTSNHEQNTDKIESLLKKAAAKGKNKGDSRESLNLLENFYKRDSDNPVVAIKYAQALREEGYFSRASLVLTPFAEDEDIKNTNILIEYSAIQAAMGNYIKAEETARRVVVLAPETGKAYHVLGIALDAQGYHEQAQIAFEKGLDRWEGDPSSILNNMGLNLAAQGFLDEAIDTLRKARDMAPDRIEIEKNLRIVSALQYHPSKRGRRPIPRPLRKPDPHTPTSAAAEAVEEDAE